MKYWIVFLLVFSISAESAPFPDLTKIELKFGWTEAAATNEVTKYYFSYNKKFFTEINKTLNSLEKTNPLYTDEFGAEDILVGAIDVTGQGDIYYAILCFGPSYDLYYEFYNVKKVDGYASDQGNIEPDFIVPNMSVIIPSNGNIYGYGHNNEFISTKHKYVYQSGKLRELPQDFFYVGKNTVSQKAQMIYSDIEQTKELYKISVGTPVTIVGIKYKDGDYGKSYYMVASEFGLVGYVKADYSLQVGTDGGQFKDFYFNGD